MNEYIANASSALGPITIGSLCGSERGEMTSIPAQGTRCTRIPSDSKDTSGYFQLYELFQAEDCWI